MIDKGGRDGLGELEIDNRYGLDSVVILTTPNQQPVFSVYVGVGKSYKITAIRDGTFLIYVAQGEDWDSATARFTRQASYFRFEEPMSFVTKDTQNGQEYSTFRITLYSVVGGNAPTLPIDESQFPGHK